MFDSLALINIESHKRTLLKFAPGLNVLIGPTDAGKSGAFRAAYWLINNRPLGEAMRPLYWEGNSKVIGKFIDPVATIVRAKGKGELNTYQLNDQKPINAGAGAPPEEIAEAILMDDVNFQTQVDRAYLMFETPGERGKILNRVAGLDDIDKSLTNSKADEQRLAREYKAKNGIIDQYEIDLKEYDDLDERSQAIKLCEQLQAYANQSQVRANKLLGLVVDTEAVDNKLAPILELLKAEKELNSLEEIVSKIKTADQRADTLYEIIEKIQAADKALKEARHLPTIDKALAECSVLVVSITQAENKVTKLRTPINRINKIDRELEDLEAEISELEKQLPESCPTCGTALKS